MKRRTIILVSFLLMLYIGPSLFAVSYASPTIPTAPNMTKDFAIAEEWYNELWVYRKSVTISGTAGAGTNYTVRIPVTYDSDMIENFDDIRFTDNDGVTLLGHWRESYTNSTSAVFWAKVSDNLDTSKTIYMYYGNPVVSTVSNGTSTFLMFEDWSSESIRSEVWDVDVSDGGVTYSAGGATHGMIARFDADAGATYRITSDYSPTAPFAVMFRSNIEEATTGNTAHQGSGYDGAFSFAQVQSSGTAGEQFYVYDDDANQDSQSMTTAYFDDWITFEVQRGLIIAGPTYARLKADNVDIELASCDPDENTNPATQIRVTDSEDDLYSDWVAVRKFITLEPEFSSFGDEERDYKWQDVGEATVYFIVPFDYWAFDMFLIFFGMVLVIASGCYLAYSLKHNMTQDKLFFFLIAFMLGWGLFLGGMLL